MTQSTLTQVAPNPYDVVDYCYNEVIEQIQEQNFCSTLYDALKCVSPIERPQGRLPVKYMAREYLRDRLALMMQITINTCPRLEQPIRDTVQKDLEDSMRHYQEDALPAPSGPMTELLCHVHLNRDAIGIESVQDIEALFVNAFDQAIEQIKVTQSKYEHTQLTQVKTTDVKSIFVIIGALLVSLFAVNHWQSLPGTAASTKPAVNSHRLRRHVVSTSKATSKSHSIVHTHNVQKH
jgi:hypothetical protein